MNTQKKPYIQYETSYLTETCVSLRASKKVPLVQYNLYVQGFIDKHRDRIIPWDREPSSFTTFFRLTGKEDLDENF